MRIVLILEFFFFLFTLPNQSKSSSCINFAFLKYLCQDFSFRLQTYKPAFIGLFRKISTPLPWWVFLVWSLLPLIPLEIWGLSNTPTQIYAWHCIVLYPPNNRLTIKYNKEQSNTLECNTMPCINCRHIGQYWEI